jgi:3D (Asp-Asp-Asp) domain-containing protein
MATSECSKVPGPRPRATGRASGPRTRRWLLGVPAAALLAVAAGLLLLDGRNRIEVTATAYTSRPSETQGDPYTAAWNNELRPGERSIAVSRDLLALGLNNGTEVEIDGLPGTYTVRDKMGKRWRRRIDIYMGNDLQRARAWGKQRVGLRW